MPHAADVSITPTFESGGLVNLRFIQSFEGCLFTPGKEDDRGADRNVHQKAVRIEGPYRDDGGGNRGVHDYPHRPTGWATAAVRTLPASLPESAQRRQGAGMARSIDAEIT